MKESSESRKNKIFKIQKRLFDILLSTFFVILFAPMFPIIALSIKLTSPGPVFYRQRRVGLDGKEFNYLKFRTMKDDAIDLDTSPVFALKSDPRITPIGRFLRKTAIDEFPAIYSVLKGDMSLIGPRPSHPFELKRYSKEQRKRLSIKPGFTGYWQTFGRLKGVNDPNEMIEMDLEYLRRQSIWLDLKIIWKTVLMSCLRRGAY